MRFSMQWRTHLGYRNTLTGICETNLCSKGSGKPVVNLGLFVVLFTAMSEEIGQQFFAFSFLNSSDNLRHWKRSALNE